ncbi:regulatory protein [Sphingobacterium sp. ML3W]|nr:regulatory protein [Sphingobacterium sp. ML3W]
MRTVLLAIFCIIFFCQNVYATKEIDSLLKVLDKAIADREGYTAIKETRIDTIKKKLKNQGSLEDQYRLNNDIILEYQSFKCDSALAYIERNIQIAKDLNHADYLSESKLKLAFISAMSGLFTQAAEIFDTIHYDSLPLHLKVLYWWSHIRYNENLVKYSDSQKFERVYEQENKNSRDVLMGLLDPKGEMYLKEMAFKLKGDGDYTASAKIQEQLFKLAEPNSHGYAMSAMGLAMVYKELSNANLEEKYLILAAITDTRLAVKENESLLTLAIHLYNKGEVNRAYNYVRASLEDANFYNSRFRNAVIARTQPIIEATYLAKIEQQRKNLHLYALLISIFAVVLILSLYFLYRQIKVVSAAKKSLSQTNNQLISVNQRLDEANLIREKYIGYYINQCAVYLDKLDEYRRNVNRKIKAGQVEALQKLTTSTSTLEKDAQELYQDFDSTFLEVYPTFVDELNLLLREEERFSLKKGQLNTELRILALIRLGITDVSQIATFLRYSIQTIYNYKSKMKGKALAEHDNFEDRVKKIGSFVQ